MPMQWKDSNNHEQADPKAVRDYLDEEDNPEWNRADRIEYLDGWAEQLKKYTPILMGVVLFLIAIGGLRLLLFGGKGGDENRLRVLEERILNLEERYKKFDSIDGKVTRIWEQAKSFENFKERFNRIEASMSLRMDHLASNIDSMQKQLPTADSGSKRSRFTGIAEKKPSKKGAVKSGSVRYHTVASKETLYGISIKYGIKLEDLLKMNHMNKNSVIQPGQKLIVKQ
jgi:LysM repeat protein